MDRPLPTVWGNATILEQVLLNLVTNTLKYVAPGVAPLVHIWSEEKERAVFLHVQDNGIGIPEEHHGRVFRVFERLHDRATYPGTGIGLAIVQKGMQRMGGRVWVDSKLGQGSCFSVVLPKAGEPRVQNDTCHLEREESLDEARHSAEIKIGQQ